MLVGENEVEIAGDCGAVHRSFKAWHECEICEGKRMAYAHVRCGPLFAVPAFQVQPGWVAGATSFPIVQSENRDAK